ncbi:PadR family transcriptional regulator [Halalkalicoccus jeotgali]|uniref:Transcription regulator n=1 Tax=Halalkalicoccus jeotgali (strain DSM 18796 / CECT 7217 / JCM 14584 / KCTC 4019 / B3) TaxID=795797 RepID=D8JAZ7_HALJB|nr:PadR family transcriptional regulator [Halalkalicoccus jeotgali]ADJ16450.1 transcription regulator [Halalkalicoccus jeotgali B3]ELY41455.1 transcriptional regulator [Halalkalicoccus jeotgali B3]
MSEAQSTPDGQERTASDLTAFQQNILTVLSEKPQYGLAIKRNLEAYYDEDVNHGRLYPNLDDLVERGLVAKSELDKRTNEYDLTEEGYDLLLGDLKWRASKLSANNDRARDLEALVE